MGEHGIRRRVCSVATGAVMAAAVALAPPAQAEEAPAPPDCGTSLTACSSVPILLPGYIRLFETFVPLKQTPEARAEYEKLLPPGFGMPKAPGFHLAWNDAHLVTDMAGADRVAPVIAQALGQAPASTAWREGVFLMVVNYTDNKGVNRDGTLELFVATDGLIGYLGRPSYPKYYADQSFVAGTNGLPNQLQLPGSSMRSAVTVRGPSTNNVSEPTQVGTFTPSQNVAYPPASFKDLTGDFRLSPNDADGGGTQQGPNVIELRINYRGAVPTSWIAGRNLGALPVPGLDAPTVTKGLVQFQLDKRLSRYDEQSPEPIPDELWDNVELSRMIDLQGTAPGQLTEGQILLHAIKDEVIGRGGCVSNNSCTYPLQHRPAPTNEPPAPGNTPFTVLDGRSCTTGSAFAVPGTCTFTTKNPRGAYFGGFLSSSTGKYEIRATEQRCTIRAYGRLATGSFGMVYSGNGPDVFKASGVGIGTLAFDDACKYELTVREGAGVVYAGQLN